MDCGYFGREEENMNTPREILFRAKRKDNEKWIEGYPVPLSINTYKQGYELITIEGLNYDELDGFCPSYTSHEIEPNTLSQFTGLYDINGNKIYENDIVLFDDDFWYISWSDEDACFVIENGGIIENFRNVCSTDCEVYGNMYDNQDLLYSIEDIMIVEPELRAKPDWIKLGYSEEQAEELMEYYRLT